MSWEPDLASVEMEEIMEKKDLPESDRDEVRRFAEFLAVRKERLEMMWQDGGPLPPMPEGMEKWVEGGN